MGRPNSLSCADGKNVVSVTLCPSETCARVVIFNIRLIRVKMEDRSQWRALVITPMKPCFT
jgi:hypothetical protein